MNKKDFWNERAKFGELSGTNDFMLEKLEIREIQQRVKENTRVLDVGCGNGSVLMELAKNKKCSGVGIDFAEKMIELARRNCNFSNIKFEVYKINDLSLDIGTFDFVISKRSLCNLDNSESQKKAFNVISSLVNKDGYYLMIEDFKEGLDKVNFLRKQLGLYEIEMPWHNLFLVEKEVRKWGTKDFVLEEVVQLSGTYYFLSRVVYAKLNEGEELRYDSEINKLSLKLPQDLTDVCVTKMYVWRKK